MCAYGLNARPAPPEPLICWHSVDRRGAPLELALGHRLPHQDLLPLAAAPRLADLNLVARLARDPPALVEREAAVVGRRDRLLDGPLHRPEPRTDNARHVGGDLGERATRRVLVEEVHLARLGDEFGRSRGVRRPHLLLELAQHLPVREALRLQLLHARLQLAQQAQPPRRLRIGGGPFQAECEHLRAEQRRRRRVALAARAPATRGRGAVPLLLRLLRHARREGAELRAELIIKRLQQAAEQLALARARLGKRLLARLAHRCQPLPLWPERERAGRRGRRRAIPPLPLLGLLGLGEPLGAREPGGRLDAVLGVERRLLLLLLRPAQLRRQVLIDRLWQRSGIHASKQRPRAGPRRRVEPGASRLAQRLVLLEHLCPRGVLVVGGHSHRLLLCPAELRAGRHEAVQLTHQAADHVGRAQARVRDGVLHAPLRCEQHDHRVVVELALLEDAPLTRQAEGDPLLDQLLQPAHKVEGREALLVLGLLLSLFRLAHADQRAATRRQLGRLILKGVEELLELGVVAVLGVKDESTQLSVHAKLLGRR
mmetsp:Transcript_46467/g.150925  ORF Transcript_46467/g.150925 Transcript_46467/m.150925 type:complete len:542 (-) Transcript_46467:421-2046(-)